MSNRRDRASLALVLCVTLLIADMHYSGMIGAERTQPQIGSRYFQETGHTVKGLFLEYWDAHGGLAQQGYPLSEEIKERSDTDGKLYVVQYFERAVFEVHPENKPPYDVLLSFAGCIPVPAEIPKGCAQTDAQC